MYDAVVIGSGIGGLTAAGLLAGVAGKKVLVLEKHTEPGGLTHVFRRDGASWDVGLHYVGDMEPGSLQRALFDYLSGGELRWNRMPHVFERFVYPGLDFAVPADPRDYEARLVERFPQEAHAIRRYFRDIRRAALWSLMGFGRAMAPAPVGPLLWLLQRLTASLPTQTTKSYLDSRFTSPELRALLASQWGDYGLPPARSAFAIHAQIVTHYLKGGWFPEGGAGRIARTFEKGVERAGGAVRVAQEAVEILVENGRAVGVRTIDRRGAEPRERVYRTPIVISNVGAVATFERLLPTTGDIGARTAALRSLIEKLGRGPSAVTLYLRLKESPATIGLKGENFWINTDLAHDDVAGHSADLLEGRPRRVYVSFPSLKSGDARFHTAEIISFVDSAAFERWRDAPKGNRGADYSRLKDRIGEGLLDLAETAIPGLRALVSYSELSTPLSVEHYTSHSGGCFYGLPATPERYRSPLLGPHTGIERLYLSGADAGCLGIVGAMMGGVGAVCQILGARGFPLIQAALKKGPPPRTAPRRTGDKKRATLVAKQRLTPTVWRLEFELDSAALDYAPGQFAKLNVGGGEWRDYSIAGLNGRLLRFLISTRTGGHGSHFVESVEPGAVTDVELPFGRYTLAQSDRRKIFVATGTGLAPFLPMFERLAAEDSAREATLIFGHATLADDLTATLAPLPARVIRCVSREPPAAGAIAGRVTRALAELAFDPAQTEFYLCGSAAMVADCREALEARGAHYINVEAY